MIRLVSYAIAAALLLYVAAAAALYLFQQYLLISNSKVTSTPAQAGLPEAVVQRFKTTDNIALTAWLVRGDSKFLAIYFHGNGASLPGRTERIRELNRLGLSVLAVEYRGFGATAGQPGESGFSRDADAAYAYARSLGFNSDTIILYGESLGTGVATALAARSPVAGVILDAPYSSAVDVAADRYWAFPIRLMMRDQFRSDLVIGKLAMPVLILHGEDDEVVPIKYGRRLSELGGKNVTFVPIEQAGHVVLDEEEAQDQVKHWLSGISGWRTTRDKAALKPAPAR
jgi:pimeloyl-ACP methyl ester carboxylesterase